MSLSPVIWVGIGLVGGFILGFAGGIIYVFKRYFNINDDKEDLEKE
jgi:hypothetical protein